MRSRDASDPDVPPDPLRRLAANVPALDRVNS
jgi:hypothetical protein